MNCSTSCESRLIRGAKLKMPPFHRRHFLLWQAEQDEKANSADEKKEKPPLWRQELARPRGAYVKSVIRGVKAKRKTDDKHRRAESPTSGRQGGQAGRETSER